MRTTTCGVATRCEKQSLASAAISASGSRGDQLAAQLAGDRDRDLDGLGLQPRLDAGEARGDALDRDRRSPRAPAPRGGRSPPWPRAAPPRSRRDRRVLRPPRSFWASSAAVAARSRDRSGAAKSLSNRNFAGAAISTPARRRRGSWSA